MKKLIICYGEENITLNQGDQHIILNNEETAYLIKSILSNKNLLIK
jgi:hypothetical protein